MRDTLGFYQIAGRPAMAVTISGCSGHPYPPAGALYPSGQCDVLASAA